MLVEGKDRGFIGGQREKILLVACDFLLGSRQKSWEIWR